VSAVIDVANISRGALVGVGVVLIGLLLTVMWVLVQSAAVARTRIRLAIDAPLQAMYETVGHAGDPPGDGTKQFVLIGTLALVVGWLPLPAFVGLFIIRG
jgi:hypothetical protein